MRAAFLETVLLDTEGRAGGPGRAPVRASPSDPIAALADALEAERERWVLWVPVLFGLGIGTYFALPFEPHGLLALVAVLAGGGLKATLRRGTLATALAGALLTMGLGFAAAKVRTVFVAAPVLKSETGIVTVRGWIESIEPRLPKGQRITLRVVSIEGIEPEVLPSRVRVRSLFDNLVLDIGEPVAIKAKLGPPPPPARPGAFDFARQAWFEGLGGNGFAVGRPVTDPTLPERPLGLVIANTIEALRRKVGQGIRDTLPGERGALADALVTGERGGISEDTNNAMRGSGLSHLIAISGFNMAIMAGALLGALRAGLAFSPRLALCYPVRKWAAAAGIAGATFCLLVSGAGPATARAYVMIVLMLLATLFDRPALSMRNLALAGLVLLAMAPETVLDVSFQMSFAAVVALMAVYEALQRRRVEEVPRLWLRVAGGRVLHFLGETLGSTIIASIAIAPIAAYHFHKISQYGLIANILVVPLFTFAVMPLAVLTLVLLPFGWQGLALWPMDWCLQWTLMVAGWVAGLDGAVTRLPAIPPASVVLMTLGMLWLCVWQRRWRMLGLVALAAGLALGRTGSSPDILVAAEGHPVAIRLADGLISALPERGANFDLSEWLAADGDGRTVEEAARGQGFRCDEIGCAASVGKLVLALPKGPEALRDDCRMADIVIMALPLVRPCPSARLVIDLAALRRRGAQTVTLEGSGLTIASVADTRGSRPWTASAQADGEPEPKRHPAGAATTQDRSAHRSPAADRLSNALPDPPAEP